MSCAGAAVSVASLSATWGAFADPVPPPPAADQQRADKELELRGVEDTLRESEEQRRTIETEIDSVRADRARLSAALIEATSKVQDAERGAAAAVDRLSSLNAAADELSRSLERRRGVIADVLAALQRMGSNPPPAILVKPDDMSEAVRAATVLGSLIPELKSEIEAARHNLDALAKTRESIAQERDELTEKVRALGIDKMRLAALIAARQQSLASAQDALGSQHERAAELAKRATSLKDLIARLDSENAARQAAADAAHAADVATAAEIEARAHGARAADTARLKPEIAFADVKGQLPLPAAGANSEDIRLARRPRRDPTGRLLSDARWGDRLRAGGRRGPFRRSVSDLRATLDHRRRRGILCPACRDGSKSMLSPVSSYWRENRSASWATDLPAWRRPRQLARRARFSI